MDSHEENQAHQCMDCEGKFSSKKHLKDHRDDYHSEECCVSLPNTQGFDLPHRIHRVDGHFTCPLCQRKIRTTRGMKSHIKLRRCQGKADDEGDESAGSQETGPATPLSSKRTFEEMVFTACGGSWMQQTMRKRRRYYSQSVLNLHQFL
ncbi:hypothetical protein BCR41DRAFT_25610 [Lobosporangium transversale]|uniref:C2H2-type domain-containing protein n=1 Tax=Lobosporangium transversale TaxID=64571 RepID=A0A1Y2G1Z0_9FUNG|nr:hypothetical protein BCR41DRAFT_25610 [Lobosporangium transversale]ORY88927.1 hypothetical protein BCR41DRAFT_25610 [Lobosporangium transversale]|eukprot:XP_021875027.1 hypothetical protein BCR41DRAFT_25610 [Lobosporangium transversale]